MVSQSAHQPKRVLVTGGCGFIGSNFLNCIHDQWPQAHFVNVDKLILNSDANYVSETVRGSKRYSLVLADIRNGDIVRRVLDENQIDTIVHFAADCTSTRCYSQPVEALENNVFAYIDFLEEVRAYSKVKKFVHISTDEVYGDSDLSEGATPKTEDQPLLPGNPYAATKAACENYANFYRQVHGLPIVMLRINNIYGPNQWNVKLMPRFVEIARASAKFPVQGSGRQLRSWLFVDDAADGIRRAAERGAVGAVYNLGTYDEKNILELAHAAQAEVDRQLGRVPGPIEFEFIMDRPYNDQRYLIDIGKAEKELGWRPTTLFTDGLHRVVESHLHGDHQPQKMSVIIYGGRGWIGQQVQRMLNEQHVPFQLAKCKVGTNSYEEQLVIAELNALGGTHVLCCAGRTHGGSCKTIEYLEGGADRLYENLRDNLFCPLALARICRRLGLHYTYVGTGYLFAYDDGEHPIGGRGFSEYDLPTFFGNSYSVIKGFTDRLINAWTLPECINARITLPLNYELNEDRNLLAKLITYKQIFDVPVSITILPDCLPALFDLMKLRFEGPLNLVNPEPISLHSILQHYQEIVDPEMEPWSTFTPDSERGRVLMATKGNCALDTALLVAHCPTIATSSRSLRDNLTRIHNAKTAAI